VFQHIKNDIDLQTRPVASCLEQVRQLVLTSGNVLSIAEVTQLENSGRQLRFRVDRAHDTTAKLIKHLQNSYDELDKLQGEMHDFSRWLQSAQEVLNNEHSYLSDLKNLPAQSERIKDLLKEIIAHQADIRFITISTQKFVDEGKEYLNVLNDLRISLPERLPNIEPIASFKSPVRQNVSELQQRYTDLLTQANAFADRQSQIRDCYRIYMEYLDRTRSWLSDIQLRVSSVIAHPVGTDIETIQEQANIAKSLYNEFLANGKLIDNLQQGLNSLLVSLTGVTIPAENKSLEIPVEEIKRDYKSLLDAVDNRCKLLEVALMQAQGVQDALDNLIAHMKQTEDKIHLQSQPASLIIEKLLEQIREHQFILSDLEMHRASVNSITESAKELLKVPSNARLAKVIETKLQNVTDNYAKLRDKAMSHNDFLESILKKLTKFNSDSTSIENELKQLQELANVEEKSIDVLMKYLQDIVQNRKKIQPAFNDCMYLGKELVERRDVTDIYVVKDKLKRLQTLWDSLDRRLDDKLRLTKQKSEKLAAFDVSRSEILLWLSQMESKTASYEPVALDLGVIKRQTDEYKIIFNEYKDFNKVIQKINDIGAEYDSLIRTSSPNANSVDRQDLTDLTSMQQELLEINNRYSFIGVRLSDRQKDLDETRSAVQRQKENLESLNAFLDKLEKNIPKYNLTVRENSEKCIKHVRKQQDEMFEKQITMDTTKIQIRDLVQSKPSVPGAETLKLELDSLVDRWQRLADLLKDCNFYSEQSLDFLETHDLIYNWLVSKEKLLSVLGPISSDPRVVSSQMQQVSVLRDEFKAQHTHLDYLREIGGKLINHFKPTSQEGKTVSNKIADIEKKWNDLADQLEKRYKNLTDVADTSKDFDASLNRLRENLQQISDALDNLPSDNDFEGKLHKITQLERQLEGQRPLLADAEATAATLTSVISDRKSCADITAKVQALGKQYLALQKKLDNIKAENDAALKDKKHFLENCAKTIGWISSKFANFSNPLLISAHRPTLQYQIETHEPIYREVMSKEYEIIMLLNRGKDLQSKIGELSDLEKINNQWNKLKEEAQDRQTRLQKAYDIYKNYEKTSNPFLQWLKKAERDLSAMKPGVLVKKELDKELRDIQTLRNDVLKKSSDFDKTQNLCSNFLNTCDVDKDTLMSEMQSTKERWDELNRSINFKIEKISGFIDKVMDFSDNFRQLSTLVQRNEDAFDSLERIHGPNAGRDPRSLEKIKTIKDDNAELKKNFQNLRGMVENIAADARPVGYNSDNLYADLERLSDRILTLQSRLDDRFNDLTVASNAVAKFNDTVNHVNLDLSGLENEFDALTAPAREVKVVKSQLDSGNNLLHKIELVGKNILDIEKEGDGMIEKGYVNRPSEIHEPLDQLKRKRSRLESRTKDYVEAVQKAFRNLTKFYEDYDTALGNISQIDIDLKNLKAVSSEADQIRLQQRDFQQFRKAVVEPMDRKIDDLSDLGRDLIRSAHETVSTSALENDLEKIIEKWSDIKSRVSERDRKLEQAFLQSGKFQDALQGILRWLEDSEEMVRNQKPPSIDYKVVKAQLQEQKFLMKMIGDNHNSIDSILKLGEEVIQGCEPAEKVNVEMQLKDLTTRFDNLKDKSNDRTKLLENALDIAKILQDQLTPLVTFLDRAEKSLKNLENIPSDEDKLQQAIFEHDKLHKEITGKEPDVASLIALKSNIRKYFEPEEADIANEKIDSVSDRFNMLHDDSERLGALLNKTKQEIKQFSLAYQDLYAWCEKQERILAQYKNISVHVDVINEQVNKLQEINNEVNDKESTIQTTIDIGNELIRSISQDEALKLKGKLDSLGRRYVDISNRAASYLSNAKDALALAQDFHEAHNRLVNWMQNAEGILVGNGATEIEILTLESDLTKMRSELEAINSLGPQLAQLSSEEGSTTLEGIITRDNRRFDAIVEQIQRKTERLQMIAQRSKEINVDLDELIQWFRDTEAGLRDASPPSIHPKIVKGQLQDHRVLNDSISGQKGRVREVTATAKKLIRELQSSNDNMDTIREKLEDLKDIVESVANLSAERLSILEQVVPLSQHFAENNDELEKWLTEIEHEISMLTAPGVRADQIMQQQEKNDRLMQTVANHKPLIDKFNKTGDAFALFVTRNDANTIHDTVEGVNTRYNALKSELRDRQLALEKALQETSQFADKLENMLRTLANAAEQIKNSEPASAHPPKISNQIDENWSVAEDLERREPTFIAIKQAADDIIAKATNYADPAVRDIKMKLEKLNVLWVDVQKEVKIRDSSLNDTLSAAEKFWNEFELVMGKLRELKDTLTSQEPIGTEPKVIQRQQDELEEVGREIKITKPEVDQVRISGNNLITLIGDSDKPEIKKHIEDLDHAWGNITALYAQREENLIQAMEKAMQFHETFENLLRFLDEAEDYMRSLKPIGSEIVLVKQQIEDHKKFKDCVDPHGVEIEALNRQLNELSEITSVDQTSLIRNGVNGINKRWDALKLAMVNRQKQLENALLQLGQFEHALNELLVWIKKTQATFDQIKIVPGDSKLLEIEMAKLKILINDAQAHQHSIDTINDAGRKLLENDGTIDASSTRDKLDNLNRQWQNLQANISHKERELDEELAEAQNFATEMADTISWLNDVDSVVGSTKPVGGLPETATEQLEKFMEIYNEIEENRTKVDNLLAQGGNYIKKHAELNVTSSNLQHSVRTLKQRWEAVVAKAADKKIKLEIALKEATDFHESLQAFVEWLTDAEKRLSTAEPISRVLPTVTRQVEEHKNFQKEIGNYRESMLQLDKKGSHLKYFSQKQDVILIKNLLVSVQHRWERVVSKGTERMRALDHGLKESKEFYDSWTVLTTWLRENEVQMNKIDSDLNGSNDPVKVRQALEQIQNIHRGLSGKQSEYDSVLRNGKSLIEKAPKNDEPELSQMIAELKELWTRNCSRSIEKQRKLEEALLLSGQFSEALTAIFEWLQKAKILLTDETPVYGDIDTVSSLFDKHKRFEADLQKRSKQIENVIQNGKHLDPATTDPKIINNLREVEQLWKYIQSMNEQKNEELQKALSEAERLHKAVNVLMEWLSDAEQKLKYAPAIPADENEAQKMLNEFNAFLYELRDKEFEKNETLSLAQNILNKAHPDAIKILRTIIQTIIQRWEEISQWALNREKKLSTHLQSLKDLDGTIDDLLAWLSGLERTLKNLEAEELPNSIPIVEQLIEDHKEFMENTAGRQGEIDMICKQNKAKPTLKDIKKPSKATMRTTR
jgi:dystonin